MRPAKYGPKPKPELDRFWINVGMRDGCWIWTGLKSVRGYGRFFRADRSQVYAHRYSWEIEHGPIPREKYVCHHCDNPPCVNPKHLFLGTQLDNMRDCVAKGRQVTVPLRGAANGMARLTVLDVERIRQEYRPGRGGNGAALAKEYGVSTASICNAAKGRTWKP